MIDSTILADIGVNFLIGALGAGMFGIAGYLNAKLADPKIKEDWAKLLGVMLIGGAGFVLVTSFGLDTETVIQLLTSAGIGAGGIKAFQVALLLGQKVKEAAKVK